MVIYYQIMFSPQRLSQFFLVVKQSILQLILSLRLSNVHLQISPLNFYGQVGYCKTLIHLQHTLQPIYCDNRNTIQIAHYDMFHKHNKHIKIDYHFMPHHFAVGTHFIFALFLLSFYFYFLVINIKSVNMVIKINFVIMFLLSKVFFRYDPIT